MLRRRQACNVETIPSHRPTYVSIACVQQGLRRQQHGIWGSDGGEATVPQHPRLATARPFLWSCNIRGLMCMHVTVL